MIVRR